MSKSTETLDPIDFSEIIGRFVRSLRRLWVLIPILGLLCSLFLGIRTAKSYTPMYESKALFTVTSRNETSDIFSSSYYDNLSAQQLAEAFPSMLSTSLMRDLMLQELGASYINGSITASSVANTNIFTLTVRSNDPQDAYDILWAAIHNFPKLAIYMVDDPHVIIQEEPVVADEPYNAPTWKSAALRGFMYGAAVAAAIIAAAGMLSQTVNSIDQLKATANLPVLAVIPNVLIKKRRSEQTQLITPDTSPEIAETLRGLSMKLRKTLEESNGKVILVTSTLSGEGKTTVSCNLARTLSNEGYRVMVIDADIRNQSVAQRLGRKGCRYGLIDLLRNSKLPLSECAQIVPNTNIAFMSGNSVTDRRYNIDAKVMQRVLDIMTQEFDYVIMDTSPCAVVADTALFCHYADCVLYVVKPDYARQTQIFDRVNDLYDRGISVAGFIYNGAHIEHGRYGYGYKYGYGYGYKYGYSYGYGYSNKNKRKHK